MGTYSNADQSGSGGTYRQADLATRKPKSAGAVARDVVMGAATGVDQGFNSLLHLPGDTAAAVGATSTLAYNALMGGHADPTAVGRKVRSAVGGGPVSADESNHLHGYDYQPQTGAGKTAQVAGNYVANALVPGGPVARTVAVALPTAGNLLASQGAKAAGFGPNGQAVAGALGGVVGGMGAGVRMPQVRPVAADVATLAAHDVNLTPGQMRGGLAKAMEDRATSIPVVGQAITKARNAGTESYTKAVVNRGLAQIGEKLPPNIPASEAVKWAGDKFGAAYDNAIPTNGIKVDAGLQTAIADLQNKTATLGTKSRAQLASIIDNRITSKLTNGSLDPSDYQAVQSGLKLEGRRFSVSPDPDHQVIADAMTHLAGAIEDAAARQNPDFGAKIMALNRGYAEQVIAEGAAAKAGARDSVFTPNHYGQAVRGADRSVRRPGGGGRATARGEALGQDMARAGQNIMPSELGNSGTADRNALIGIAGAVTGAGEALALGHPAVAAGTLAAPLAGLGISAAAARAYSPKAIAAANAVLRARIASQNAQPALAAMKSLAARDRSAARLYTLLLTAPAASSVAAQQGQ